MLFQQHSLNKMRKDSIDLHKNKIHIVRTNKSGKEITCLNGTIWITQTGDGADRILKCGDIYKSRIPGEIVIQALDNASIKISSMNKIEVIEYIQNRIQPQLSYA